MLDQPAKLQSVVMNQQRAPQQQAPSNNLQFMDSSTYGDTSPGG
jgi:hypothetical protein